jgi:hypothetical protein
MKKQAFKRAVFLIVAVIGLNLISQAQTPSDEFLDVYRQALELNKNRFQNLDLIQIGDVVIFPSRFITNSYEALIAPAPINGQHASIWTLTEDYLRAEIIPLAAEAVDYYEEAIAEPASVEPASSGYEEAKKQPLFPRRTIIALSLIFFFVLLGFIKKYQKFWKRLFRFQDSDSNIPIVTNIKNLNPQQLINILKKLYLQDNERLIAVKQSILRSNTGSEEINALMQFGSAKARKIILKSGEKIFKLEIINLKSLQIRTQYLHGICLHNIYFENSHFPLSWELITDEVLMPETKPSKIA